MSRTNALWIAFAGRRSDDMGVRVAALPDVPVAAARGTAVAVPGRDGSLWLPEEAFDDIALKVPLELLPGADAGAISAWLTGEGELITSDAPARCFRARVTRGFEWKRGAYASGRLRAEVEFTCQPFRYEPGNPAMARMAAPCTFEGRGNWSARPVITVYGTGDIDLMVNGASVLLDGVEDSITLDCEAMMAFRDGVNRSPKVTLMSEGDEWPRLNPGTNAVNWSGAVEGVEIRPNWRWR